MAKTYTVSTIFKAIDRFSTPLLRMTSGMGKFEQRIYYMDRHMSNMAMKLGLVFTGMAAGFGLITREAGWFEQSVIRMSTKLNGSTFQAKKLVGEIQKLATITPLTSKPLINAGNLLLGSGVKKDNLLPLLKQLGDLAQGDDIALEGITRGYSRIYTEDRVTREHLDRFITRGIPILATMGKNMNVSQKQLAIQMKRGNISFLELKNAINTLTAKGGLYYNSMELQAQTLNGLLAQFSERIVNLGRNIGEVIAPVFKHFIRNNISFLDNVQNKFTKIFKPIELGKRAFKDEFGRQVYNSDGTMVYEHITMDSDATTRVKRSFKKLFDTIARLSPNIDKVFDRLAQGTSLFYDFMDVLAAFIKGIKFLISVVSIALKVFDIPVLGNVLKWFTKGMIMLGAFLAPLGFVLVKISALFNVLRALPFLEFAKWINTIFTSITLWGKKSLLSFLGVAKKIGLKLPSILGKIGTKFLGFITVLLTVFNILYKNSKSYKSFVSNVSSSFDSLIGIMDRFSIADEIIAIFNNIKNIVISLLKGDLTSLFLSIYKSIHDIVAAIPKLLVSLFGSVTGVNVDKTLGLFNSDWIQDIIDKRFSVASENGEVKITIDIKDNTSDKLDTEVLVESENNKTSIYGDNVAIKNIIAGGVRY